MDFSTDDQLAQYEWQHIVAVYDGSNAILYLNGTEIDNRPLALNTQDDLLLVGTNGYRGGSLDGKFDDIRLYDRALTPGEVAILAGGRETLSATTLADALDVDHDLTITSGGLDASSQDIFVGGDWANSATFVPGGNTVTFDGADAQSISSDTFYNLTIANTHASPGDSQDVDADALTVTNTLTVSDGQFQPASGSSFNDVTITSDGIFKPDAAADITVTGDWTNSGTFTANLSNVHFQGFGGSQTITSGGDSFYDFTVDGGDYDSSLIGYWAADEGSGSTVADSIGSNTANMTGSWTGDTATEIDFDNESAISLSTGTD